MAAPFYSPDHRLATPCGNTAAALNTTGAESAPMLDAWASGSLDTSLERYVRARLFDYRFTTTSERRATGAWWVREDRGLYCPPISLRDRE